MKYIVGVIMCMMIVVGCKTQLLHNTPLPAQEPVDIHNILLKDIV